MTERLNGLTLLPLAFACLLECSSRRSLMATLEEMYDKRAFQAFVSDEDGYMQLHEVPWFAGH